MFVLNALYMTQFVTSSVAVFEAAMGKINVYDKIVMKKKKKIWKSKKFIHKSSPKRRF